MWMTALSALLSYWRRQPLQLAMLFLGLSAATALWTGVQAINSEARASYDQAAQDVTGGGVAYLAPRDGGVISIESYSRLRGAGWRVSPVVEGEATFGAERVRLLGVEPLTLPREAEQVALGEGEDLAKFLLPPGLMIVDPALALRLEGTTAPPIEVRQDAPPETGLVDIAIAQQILGVDGISRLLLDPNQPEGLAPLGDLAPELERRVPAGSTDLARLTDSFHLNLTAFGLLSFAVGLFIVYAAIGLAFEQRRSTFRTLRALGVSARALTVLLLGELLVLAFLAGVAGVALGYAIAAALLPDVAATLRGLYGADVAGAIRIRPSWWAAGLGIALFGALAAASQSLWRAGRLPLLDAAKPRAWARASEAALRWQTGAAVLLLLIAVLAGRFGTGLVGGFATLGALLLGAALGLPPLLSAAIGFCRSLSRGALTQWFWADARQQLPGLSLALMALMLALATNLGVGTMVASFRVAFVGYLDQRLAAELYVQARSDREAESMEVWLQPKVDAVLPLWNVEAQVLDAPVDILGQRDHATYRENWPLLSVGPGAWDRVARGEAVLVNEQLARRKQLAMGDRIAMPGGWSAQVAGVYSDYGNPKGQIIVDIAVMQRRFPEAERSRLGVRTGTRDIAEVAADLREAFDLPATNIIDQAALKRLSLQIFERTFAVTAALNVLTLGVAAIAMFASLMTLSGVRLPQLAPVWAVGVTRARLAQLELVRTLALAGLTMLAAIPVGLMLAWVLLAVVNVAAFGWKLPMRLFPFDWLQLGGLALLSALVAAAIPVRRLARLAPSDLLKVFANER